MTYLDLITACLRANGVTASGETPTGDEANDALQVGNSMLDSWNAESLFIYSSLIQEFTLTPAKNPHTIGVTANSPDFTVTGQRPVRIDQANLILTDVTPNIYRPLKIVDDSWWMNNPVPSLSTQIPYYLFYNEAWPNGQIYLWPVPSTAYGIRLNMWTPLIQFPALTTAISLPPGYEEALKYNLCVRLAAEGFGILNPATAELAVESKARIQALNLQAPSMQCDGAVQSMDSRPRASIANFLSGFFN